MVRKLSESEKQGIQAIPDSSKVIAENIAERRQSPLTHTMNIRPAYMTPLKSEERLPATGESSPQSFRVEPAWMKRGKKKRSR